MFYQVEVVVEELLPCQHDHNISLGLYGINLYSDGLEVGI